MKPHDLERIRASQGWRRHRTEAFETDDGPVIVKGQRPPRGPAAAAALRLLAAAARAPELLPVPAPGGAAGQAIEVRRLQELRAAGVRVPALLHVDADFFVMERLPGPSLGQRLAQQPDDASALWQQGLRFLHDVHGRGQYLSQASARNLILTDTGVAAIDFEDDPQAVLQLQQAQVRDWLLYLQSTTWLLPRPLPELLALWQQQAPAGAEAAALRDAAARMAWLRHLPTQRKPWGRDLVSAQAAAALLHAWVAGRRPQ